MDTKTLPVSTAVATLPGGFNGILFALAAPRHSVEVALLGVVAAHTSLRALWGGLHHNGHGLRPTLEALGQSFRLSRDLAVIEKGVQDGAEWWLMAQPNVIPATEESARAYAGRKWPLPPQPILPMLDAWALDTRVGDGDYLAAPHLDGGVWKQLIRRAVVGEEVM
jgi:hypothetical protein